MVILWRFSLDRIAVVVIALGIVVGSGQVLAQRPLGIDVSSYQGSSDKPPTNVIWTNVKSAGISFTWAKATEGTNYIDANFAYNEVNAKAAGVLIGAYHFAHPEEHLGLAGADIEAAYFWNEIQPYITANGTCMMPMLDYETSPGSSYTKATSSQWVNEWCQDIVNYGASNGIVINPVIYTYTSFATTWLNTSVTNWPLWMAASLNGQTAQTGAPFSTSPWSTWAFWQYGQGTVSGVEGAVDEDVFNGTAATLSNYVINGPFAPTTITLNSLTPSTYGEPVSFTATVAPTPSGGIVQFYTNGAAFGGPLDASGGTATYFTSLLPVGSYQILASYSGAIGFAASSTASSIQQVNPAVLNITASPQSRAYGTLLTFGSGSTQFGSSGLQNNETIGTVTLVVSGNGDAASAPVGTYTLTPSLATGGTFTATNYNITYNPGSLSVTLPSNTIPVTILGVGAFGNGTVQLNFTGTPGYVYLIEAATNLSPPITWTTLSTNAADTNGLFSFLDASAASYPERYYRTAIQ